MMISEVYLVPSRLKHKISPQQQFAALFSKRRISQKVQKLRSLARIQVYIIYNYIMCYIYTTYVIECDNCDRPCYSFSLKSDTRQSHSFFEEPWLKVVGVSQLGPWYFGHIHARSLAPRHFQNSSMCFWFNNWRGHGVSQ